MTKADGAVRYAHEHQREFLDNLLAVLHIPSVSTDPDLKNEVRRAAQWMADRLTRMGIEQVEVMETAGHPIVYGEYLHAGDDRPIVLVYGHYDVQPAEPVELWSSNPFEPVIVDNQLFARGASDMKGQISGVFSAIESIFHEGDFPVNLKFLLEGEEEVGSPNLEKFLVDNKTLLKSSFALNADTGMISKDVPTIVFGLRGLAYFEIRVTGPEHDLHSGVFGGVVENPANVLCRLIGLMHDEMEELLCPVL